MEGANTDLPSDMVAFSECNVTWSCSDSDLQLLNKGLDLLILDMIVDKSTKFSKSVIVGNTKYDIKQGGIHSHVPSN